MASFKKVHRDVHFINVNEKLGLLKLGYMLIVSFMVISATALLWWVKIIIFKLRKDVKKKKRFKNIYKCV